MDTFIDKLAQKKNAQEMIRANSAAEAAKMEQMQRQIREYDGLMQEIRRVNIKTAENMENMGRLMMQYTEKLEHFKVDDRPQKEAEEQIAAIRGLLEEQVASSKILLEEQVASSKALLEEQITAVKGLLDERLAQTEDIVHKENVKVYRNVQAAFMDELEKQTQQGGGQKQEDQGKKAPSKLLAAILIGVIVDIVINLLPLM